MVEAARPDVLRRCFREKFGAKKKNHRYKPSDHLISSVVETLPSYRSKMRNNQFDSKETEKRLFPLFFVKRDSRVTKK